MLEEAHGICVLAGSVFKTTTSQRHGHADDAEFIAPTALSYGE
jgi:hypothetical protein